MNFRKNTIQKTEGLRGIDYDSLNGMRYEDIPEILKIKNPVRLMQRFKHFSTDKTLGMMCVGYRCPSCGRDVERIGQACRCGQVLCWSKSHFLRFIRWLCAVGVVFTFEDIVRNQQHGSVEVETVVMDPDMSVLPPDWPA